MQSKILWLTSNLFLLSILFWGGCEKSTSPDSNAGIPGDSIAPKISYLRKSISATIGIPIIPDTVESTGGNISGFSIAESKSLPSGLKLDKVTGVLSGIPVTESASTNYSIVATGPGGKGEATITISVSPKGNDSIGANWKKRDLATTNDFRSVVWNGTNLVAVSYTGFVWTSSDGENWTAKEIVSSPKTQFTCVATTIDKKLIAFSGYNFGGPLISEDGINWEKSKTFSIVDEATTTSLDIIQSAFWDGNKLFAVGDHGIFSSSDGSEWEHVFAKPFISGTTASAIFSMAWTGTKFVAVGSQNALGRPTIVTSLNGKDWTDQNAGTIGSALMTVVWTGKKLIAAGRDGLLVTSEDGISWAVGSAPTSIYSLIWVENQLIGVGEGGYIGTSPDGVKWTKRSSGTTSPLVSITWTGKFLVAMGWYGAVVTSP